LAGKEGNPETSEVTVNDVIDIEKVISGQLRCIL